MTAKRKQRKGKKKTGLYPFRAAVFRGLGVLVPPLLTIFLFLLVGTTVQEKFLGPIVHLARQTLVQAVRDVRVEVPGDRLSPQQRQVDNPIIDGVIHQKTPSGAFIPMGFSALGDGTAIPTEVFKEVYSDLLGRREKPTADDYFERYVDKRWLPWYLVVPCFLSVFILALYLLGKFMAARIGRFFWGQFERGVNQVPLVRNVYGAVKQVSDFLLREREQEYSRVVAVEWPRKGIWSLALVTGQSMIDIEAAANEPVMSVLIPTSPMPMTGFALTVKKSETIDLNISIDEAIQFIVSCGVVVPPGQIRPQATATESQARIESNDAPAPADI